MQQNQETHQTVLGIDLGSNSIGWALLETRNEKPVGILARGVRVFEAGFEGMEMDGRGKSRNVARREARLMRRQTERRTRRLSKLARLLQRNGLLPEGELDAGEQRHQFFTELDKNLYSKWAEEIKESGSADLPYILRARALDEKLTPHEVGRALYHLAQRRGFLSNRKSTPKRMKSPVK